MSVLGIGVDAIEIDRVRAAVARTPSLLARLFTPAEQALCTSGRGELAVGRLAARFAAKEAVAKALRTGVIGFAWVDVEVTTDALGAPTVALHDGARVVADRLGVARIHLSLSTSATLAVASAVLEGTPPSEAMGLEATAHPEATELEATAHPGATDSEQARR